MQVEPERLFVALRGRSQLSLVSQRFTQVVESGSSGPLLVLVEYT